MMEVLPVMPPGQQVTIDGFLVPRLTVSENAATGQWNVCYDGRFSITASLEELQRWIWLVAQAQAVGGGYSCHGENSVYQPNPHKVRVMCIGSIQTEPATGTLGD
ncbi:hypothetical protein RCH27_08395 [Paracidovorax citrulli]|uniref:hypothetical protein n=1 Tax=Paracidovorax citrulli TaxID=80869 RepID=UPI003A80389A